MDHKDVVSDMCRMRQDEYRILRMFGRRVRYYRKLKDLSQERLGELSCVSYKYIGEIERGRKKVSIIVIYRLAHAFQISMTDLTNLSQCSGEGEQKYIQSIIRLLESRDLVDLKKALHLLKICLKEDA